MIAYTTFWGIRLRVVINKANPDGLCLLVCVYRPYRSMNGCLFVSVGDHLSDRFTKEIHWMIPWIHRPRQQVFHWTKVLVGVKWNATHATRSPSHSLPSETIREWTRSNVSLREFRDFIELSLAYCIAHSKHVVLEGIMWTVMSKHRLFYGLPPTTVH